MHFATFHKGRVISQPPSILSELTEFLFALNNDGIWFIVLLKKIQKADTFWAKELNLVHAGSGCNEGTSYFALNSAGSTNMYLGRISK